MNEQTIITKINRKRMTQPLAAILLIVFAAFSAFAQNTNNKSPQNEVGKPAAINLLPIDAHQKFDEQMFFKTFRHSKARVNNVNLHYVIGGQGDPVVLLNGFPETWYAWRKIMPALAEKYTVIAVDVRGTGDSEKAMSGYDARNVAEDIHQLVRSLGFSRVKIVAYDISGRVGYAYAAAHRQEVTHLALMETLLPGFGLDEAMDVAKGGSYHFGFFANVPVASFLVQGKEREYLTMLIRDSAFDKAAISQEDLEVIISHYSAPEGMRGGFMHYNAFLGDSAPNRESAKQKLKMPVLALYGAGRGGDTGVLPQTLTAVAENVQGEGVLDCGHFIAEERPDYLAARLLNFFGAGK